jgi:hypothetical protein
VFFLVQLMPPNFHHSLATILKGRLLGQETLQRRFIEA